MANRRIFYPTQAIGFSVEGGAGVNAYIAAHGVQSMGVTTNFTTEQVFELGQINIYENIEAVPDIELTVEKVLDGYPLLWHLATKGASASTLVARAAVRCSPAIAFFGDTQEAASGVAISELNLSGMVPSQITYTIPVQGNATESMTLIGNNKVWKDISGGATVGFSGTFTNSDQSLAFLSGSGGIVRREDVVFGPLGAMVQETGVPVYDVNNQLRMFYTILPPDIDGIGASGLNTLDSAGAYSAHLQTLTVSCSLNREDVFELGHKIPYFRFANFPIEVTTEIETLGVRGDFVNATEAGSQTGIYAGNNTRDRSIRIRLREGTFIDCGTSNRLTSIAQTGGDTGGGNVTYRYSYRNFNNLTVTHPRDPSNLTWPY